MINDNYQDAFLEFRNERELAAFFGGLAVVIKDQYTGKERDAKTILLRDILDQMDTGKVLPNLGTDELLDFLISESRKILAN